MFINRYTKFALTIAIALAGRHFLGMDHMASSTDPVAAVPMEIVPAIADYGSPEWELIKCDLEQQLLKAASVGNLAAVMDSVNNRHGIKIDIDVMNDDGETALEMAAQKNYLAIAHFLVKSNANINLVSKTGFTPLHKAVIYNNLAMAQFLVTHDADVNAPRGGTARFRSGDTPLHCSHDVNMIRFLVANEADVYIKARDDRTALDRTEFVVSAWDEDMIPLDILNNIIAYLKSAGITQSVKHAILVGEDFFPARADDTSTEGRFPPEHVDGTLRQIVAAAIVADKK